MRLLDLGIRRFLLDLVRVCLEECLGDSYIEVCLGRRWEVIERGLFFWRSVNKEEK